MMRRTFAVLSFVAALGFAAVSLTILPSGTTRAAASADYAMFVIPAHDGYGVADCLTGGAECGQVVANAWCEAHGFSRAQSFGPTVPGEMTSAVETAAAANRGQRPIAITCAN